MADVAVLEDLTDEECALMAILMDESGLDIAEFAWYAPENADGCFRAWPFQWTWWRTDQEYQIDQCARSVGKSLSIKVRGFAFPFLYPGQEMVITAPELVHLEPIVGLVETQLYATRLSREMIPRGKSAVTHRPFEMNFVNGARIIGRIPQRDGKGVKGIHPIWLELDEAQDYPHAGWVELTETLKQTGQKAVWRAHGVTRGLRDDFYEHTQDTPDNHWKVHRYPAMYRPTWTATERENKIKQYGSRDDPDYRRNVLGLHGDTTNPLFVLHRLMACVDQIETSSYNDGGYFHTTIKAESLAMFDQPIVDFLDFPMEHKSRYGKGAIFWCGMDVGYTVDPSEIVVFVEYRPKGSEVSVLRLLTRINLTRIGHHDQVRVIKAVLRFYKPRVFAMDKGGLGLPLLQDLQEQAKLGQGFDPKELDIIKGYNFSEKILVDFDETVEVEDPDDVVAEAGLKRNTKEYASDTLRSLVDSRRLELPWDKELLKQYQGSTYTYSPGLQDQYGKRIYSKGNDHVLDASRFAALGWAQYHIEEMMKMANPVQPVYDSFISF